MVKKMPNTDSKPLTLEIKGAIGEEYVFEKVDPKNSEIMIDLGHVTSISSTGIKNWLSWVNSELSGKTINLTRCPLVVVDQLNMIEGFLPKNATVDSFFVPYFCEESGAEKRVLFRQGVEFDGVKIFPPDNVKCDETGEIMEMDVIEEKYFLFLKKLLK